MHKKWKHKRIELEQILVAFSHYKYYRTLFLLHHSRRSLWDANDIRGTCNSSMPLGEPTFLNSSVYHVHVPMKNKNCSIFMTAPSLNINIITQKLSKRWKICMKTPRVPTALFLPSKALLKLIFRVQTLMEQTMSIYIDFFIRMVRGYQSLH
jgi:hypothetical protein